MCVHTKIYSFSIHTAHAINISRCIHKDSLKHVAYIDILILI